MTKKDIAILLAPNVIFIGAAIMILFFSSMIRQKCHDDKDHQKFDTFVRNVQSGKWQLTTDKWLKGMRLEHDTADAYQKACFEIGETMRAGGWLLFVGILWQIGAVYTVGNRMRKS